MKRMLSAAVGALALAACGSVNAPLPATTVPEALPDALALSSCGEVSAQLDRRTNFKPALLNFLDAVRLSGCPYAEFRVDMADDGIGAAYNDSYSRSEALSQIRDYRRVYDLGWEARPYLRDARLPEAGLRVVFLPAG